jgi:hypothetical protein
MTDVTIALILWDVEPKEWQHFALVQLQSAPHLLLDCLLACELERHLLPNRIIKLVFSKGVLHTF